MKQLFKHTPFAGNSIAETDNGGITRPLIGSLLAVLILLLNGCGSGAGDGIDPGVIEIPVAFIKRPVATDEMGQSTQSDLREPLFFVEGGDVYIRTNSTVNATVSNVTQSITQGRGDVKGMTSSYDGTRLMFSLRLFDPDLDDDLIPSWNIYEYDIPTSQLRRVISSNFLAGKGNDLYPVYLPDDRIVFSSDRQTLSRQMLIDEGKSGYAALDESGDTVAMVLHVMNSDGSDIHQISFNQSHDLYPVVLSRNNAGQVLFTRWDNAEANSAMHLYKMNPDGSELELVYGRHSHATGTNNSDIQFVATHELDNGDLMLITRPFSGTFEGGDIVTIDSQRFVDNDKPVWSLAGMTGPAQVPATGSNVTTDGSLSLDGRYSSVFPVKDGSGRLLVSKSSCQVDVAGEIRPCIAPWVNDPAAVEASPSYAIWLYDPVDETTRVVVLAETGQVITEAIAIQPISSPPIIFDKGPGQIDSALAAEGFGVINIKSVYDLGDNTFDGCFYDASRTENCTTAVGINSLADLSDPAMATADQRPARFVRFLKKVGFPDEDDPEVEGLALASNNSLGRRRNLGMREIIGYAPVEPDGSVKVEVPANIPLALEVLDRAGRRIGPRHANWFQVVPGDILTCGGCHTHDTGTETPEIHGRTNAAAPSVNPGLGFTLQFPNTLIPGLASPNPYWGNLGQTMAEVRFDRIGLVAPPTAVPRLSQDLVFEDYWTDPSTAGRAADASFSYSYANLAPVPSPINPSCIPGQDQCRAIINYPEHIHPIWQVDRAANTCVGCHTTSDAMGNDRVADGQLDLTDGISDQNGQQLKSYRELFFNDQGEEIIATMLVNIQILVPVLDGDGNPVLDDMDNPVFELIDDPNAVVNGTMNSNGARVNYFSEKLIETELNAGRSLTPVNADPLLYVDHSGMLSAVELKLISEWLDIGAQIYNDPFNLNAP